MSSLADEHQRASAQASCRAGEEDLADALEAVLRREPSRARLPAIEPLVVARCIDDWMSQAVEPTEASLVVRVGAGTPEDVADVHDGSEVVRIELAQDETELEVLPRIVRGVPQDGEREGTRGNGRRRRRRVPREERAEGSGTRDEGSPSAYGWE